MRPVHNFDEHSPQSTPNDYDAHLSYNEQPPMTERSDWDTDGRNNLQQRNHRLEAELKSRGSQIAQLQEFIQQEKDKGLQSYERLECSLQLGPQVYDNAVQQKFDYLFASIKTWSSEFREFKKLSKCEAREFQAVLPSCTSLSQMNDLFAVNKKRRLFVRGWAAYIMSTKLSWLVEQDKSYRSWNLNQWLDETSAQSFSQIEEKLRSAGKSAILPMQVLRKLQQTLTNFEVQTSKTFLLVNIMNGERSLPNFYGNRTEEKTLTNELFKKFEAQRRTSWMSSDHGLNPKKCKSWVVSCI